MRLTVIPLLKTHITTRIFITLLDYNNDSSLSLIHRRVGSVVALCAKDMAHMAASFSNAFSFIIHKSFFGCISEYYAFTPS